MSFEGSQKEKKGAPHTVKAAIAGAMMGGAVMGGQVGHERAEIKAHALSPAVISELKQHYDATDAEIAGLEQQLKEHLRNELTRMRQTPRQ